jgi:hypothetical protein
MGPLVTRMGATVKGCFNVAVALLAAPIQLSAVLALAPFLVSSGSSLATPEKPATAKLENCRTFSTSSGEAHSSIDCIFADDRSSQVQELLKVDRF